MIRVRIAPSPTGIPHIGNTRTALFNYLFAKHNKGKFIVRVEDTDQARIVPGAKEAIFEILNWLGILWDEEYTQSERTDIYKEHVNQLLKKDLAYKDEGAVRFKVPAGKEISWTDAIGNKKISFKTDVIEDFVILKSDGFPTYHLANVVDDRLMDISHVIRGDEWISSTPKHILLYEAFGWKLPIFAHLPVILGPDKTKLSKRHGAKSVLDYKKEGYLKEALLNFMALLGWNPGGDKEIMDINEMIKLFDLKDVNTASPIFDIQKLEWMNSVYIKDILSTGELVDILGKSSKIKNLPQEQFLMLVKLAKTRMKTLKEFDNLIDPFLNPPKIPLSAEDKKLKTLLRDKLTSLRTWNLDSILNVIKDLLLKEGIGFKSIYKIVIGIDKGMPIANVLEILGRDKSLKMLS